MNLKDITLVLGVDAKHLKELHWVWPTWMRFKPELREMPCVVFYDVEEVKCEELAFLQEHPNMRLVPWELPNARNQREKMLTGFVRIPAQEVMTPWYLKIDTDVIATGAGKWIEMEWFEPDAKGELPVFIASPWGYSKPRYVMDVLDDWADGVPMLAGKPRLNLPYASTSSKVRHPRIISWLFFGRTDWTREMATLTEKEGWLPYPSQDSFMFYCAERLSCRYVRVQMNERQWTHQRPARIREMLEGMGLKLARSKPEPSGQRGVIYYNMGTSCAVRLLVSLATLRKHYAGEVAILSEGDESHALCEKIAKAFDVRIVRWHSGVEPGKNMPFLAKTRLHLGTPFTTTIALDSDTLVTGPIDELFEFAERDSFCVAQLGDWRTDGKIIQSRLRKWGDILPNDVEAAVSFGPAINTGVVAFRKDTPIFEEWYEIAKRGREHFIPDEVSCQMILHRHPHRILDGQWNRSCRHDNPDLPDTRIIHYHGKKHCRPGLPFHAGRWVEGFHEVHRENLAGMRDWMPAGDRMLKRHLKAHPEKKYDMPYGDHFMSRRHEKHRGWQNDCGRILASFFDCQSVIDLGCGIGSWLEGFKQGGVAVVRGFEMSYASAARYMDPGLLDCISQGDLSQSLHLGRRYDLAICIEVVEHIAKEFAMNAIQNLVMASDCIFFSAARPGQKGTGHINCQNKDYWLGLFAKFGYNHCPSESEKLRALMREGEAASWVLENGMVVRKWKT